MRVLLVENNPEIAQGIELLLKAEGFNVYATDLGEEAVDLGKLYDYDIILLDLHLQDMSGHDVIRNLRLAKVPTPIMVLSGSADLSDKTRALSKGADDYLVKPFASEEMIGRIHAIVRRSKGHAANIIEAGMLHVNLDAKNVRIFHDDGTYKIPDLTMKEYTLLELLTLRQGKVQSRETLMDHLYGGIDEPDMRVIDIFISKLRKKLFNFSGGRNFIRTVWGGGYIFHEPDSRDLVLPFHDSSADQNENTHNPRRSLKKKFGNEAIPVKSPSLTKKGLEVVINGREFNVTFNGTRVQDIDQPRKAALVQLLINTKFKTPKIGHMQDAYIQHSRPNQGFNDNVIYQDLEKVRLALMEAGAIATPPPIKPVI